MDFWGYNVDDFDTANLIYLGLIAFFAGSYVLYAYRGRMGAALQQALIWVMLFFAMIILYGFKDTIQQQLYPRQGIEVSENVISLPRARDNHFYVDLLINGTKIEFVIDTGATEIVLTESDAQRAGISLSNLRYIGLANTANGEVRTAPVTLNTIELRDITDYNIRASVNEGQMNSSLLGMRYLSLFSRFEIVGDTLLLHR